MAFEKELSNSATYAIGVASKGFSPNTNTYMVLNIYSCDTPRIDYTRRALLFNFEKIVK